MQNPILLHTLHIPDERGYNAVLFDTDLRSHLPTNFQIVQINQGFSTLPYTLRGLHYQLPPHDQAKLCYCLTGSVFNVALNLETGEIHTATLKPGNAMFIPRGYAHGYLTLEHNTLFQWCVDNAFAPDAAHIIRYDSCGINRPEGDYIVSDKDRAGEEYSKQASAP